jgi:hypothetical protein
MTLLTIVGEKVRHERRWNSAGACPAQKLSMAIGFETGKAALALNPKPACGFRSATDAIPLPEKESRTLRKHLVVPSIQSREVTRVQRPNVRGLEHFL